MAKNVEKVIGLESNASTVIKMKDGTMIFVRNSFEDIKQKMKDDRKSKIEVEIAGRIEQRANIKKKNVSTYAKYESK